MSQDPEEQCIADRCQKRAQKDRKYCRGHREREQQHKPIDTPLRDWGQGPYEYLEAKALAVANAKDEGERAYKLAQKRLKAAATQYVLAAVRWARKRPKLATTPQTTRRG